MLAGLITFSIAATLAVVAVARTLQVVRLARSTRASRRVYARKARVMDFRPIPASQGCGFTRI